MGQYDADELRIARQRAIAKSLRDSGNVSFDPAASSGRLVYARSPWEDIASIVNTGVGAYADRKGDKLTEALAKRKQSDAQAGVESSLDALVGASQKGMPQTADNPMPADPWMPKSPEQLMTPQDQRLGPSMHVPVGTTAPFPGLTEKNTKRQQLADVVRGKEQEWGPALEKLSVERALAQPVVKDDYTVGATRFSGKDNRVLATDPVALETRKAKEITDAAKAASDAEEAVYKRSRDAVDDKFRERQIASLEESRRQTAALAQQTKDQRSYDPADPANQQLVDMAWRGDLDVAKFVSSRTPEYGKGLVAAIESRSTPGGPKWSMGDYAKKLRTDTSFETGGPSSAAAKLTSFVAVANHIQSLRKLIEAKDAAINTGNLEVANKAKQYIGEQLNTLGVPSFELGVALLAKELNSALVAGGGIGAERKDLEDHLLKSGEVAKQQLDTAEEYLRGQNAGLENRVVSGYPQVIPEAERRQMYRDRYVSDPVMRALVDGGHKPASAAPVKVATEEEYNKLAPGTEYIAPDGSHKRKK